MVRLSFTAAGLASLLMMAGVRAQDRSACTGIYCPQVKAADSAAELAPYMAPGKDLGAGQGQEHTRFQVLQSRRHHRRHPHMAAG